MYIYIYVYIYTHIYIHLYCTLWFTSPCSVHSSFTSGGLGLLFGLNAATYDGDTPESERRERREGARVLLTNPDTLHESILPNHKAWRHVLANLR